MAKAKSEFKVKELESGAFVVVDAKGKPVSEEFGSHSAAVQAMNRVSPATDEQTKGEDK